MAIKRRRSQMKRTAKRRRFNTTSRGGIYRPRPFAPARLRGATLKVKRIVHSGVLSPAATLTTGTSYFWQYNTIALNKGIKQFNGTSTSLSGLSNLSEYTALFDQYRLGAYKVTLRPRFMNVNLSQQIGTGAAASPGYYPPSWVILQDGRNTVTPSGTYAAGTLNVLLEAGGKIKRADREVSIYVKPLVKEQYGSGATRYVKPKFTDLDTPGQGMEHQGFHLFLMRQGFNSDTQDTQLSWDVFITYYLTFKNQK